MPDLHKILKDTRIQQGIELEEIHNRTKININFLMALENGDYDILPTPYIRLFLRAYGNEVGLDPEELIAQYEESQTDEETYSTSKDKKTVVLSGLIEKLFYHLICSAPNLFYYYLICSAIIILYPSNDKA